MTEKKEGPFTNDMLIIPVLVVGFVFMVLAYWVARLTGNKLLTRITLATPTLLISNILLAGPLIVLCFIFSLNLGLIPELTLAKQIWVPAAAAIANWLMDARINLPFFLPFEVVILPVVILVQVGWWFCVGRFINDILLWFVWPQDR